jgi:hypothetical protein
MKKVSERQLKTRRSWMIVVLAIALAIVGLNPDFGRNETTTLNTSEVLSQRAEGGEYAQAVLETLVVKGRAPKTGYARDEFGSGWATIGDCDTRNVVLRQSLLDVVMGEDNCTVLSGVLDDPYTGTVISFRRGGSTSGAVQIDHVVALSDAWQKGAQDMDFTKRVVFANDPLNLLAVDGPANQQKGDKDAASWLPMHKPYRCQYVARQVAIKKEYGLWVTEAEKAAMKRVLNGCGEQRVPIES